MIFKDYRQPSFYHFSNDSIQLAHLAVSYFPKEKTIYDLGAGSGVVGLEYLIKSESTNVEVIFIEKQEAFLESLRENIKHFLPTGNMASVVNHHFYDTELKVPGVILSNPPFYLMSEGRHPPHINKKNCHFWNESELLKWCELIKKNNKLGGKAIICSRKKTQSLAMIETQLQLSLIKEQADTIFFKIN